jgi:protein-S-isoprenylcysteine O-methyltransferase Ste14
MTQPQSDSQPQSQPTDAPSSHGNDGSPDPAAASGAPESGSPPGGLLFRYRSVVGVALAISIGILCLLHSVAIPVWRMPLVPWHLGVGFALLAGGVSLRLWAILQIGGSARKTSRLKAVRIISWGPFALVRNPLYIANATVFAGFTVLCGFYWILPLVLAVLWIWYDAIVRREETFLDASFPGEYAAYRQSTNRWIPRFKLRKRPPDVPPYPLLRALKRERGHLLAVTTGLILGLAFRFFAAHR